MAKRGFRTISYIGTALPPIHDDVIKREHFPRYCTFLKGIQRYVTNGFDFPHKGQWRGALMFSLICAWTNGWANNRYTADLKRHSAHYDVTVIPQSPHIRIHSVSHVTKKKNVHPKTRAYNIFYVEKIPRSFPRLMPASNAEVFAIEMVI